MRLSILLFCFLSGACWPSDYRCVYQPKIVSVDEEDSVTIPCTYVYPKYLGEILVIWGETDGPYCSEIKNYITDRSGNVTDEYKERVSTTTHHDKNQTASITIRGLNATHRTLLCCWATIIPNYNDDYPIYTFFGTLINFADGGSVSQVEELIAVPGEEVTIPCDYPQETLGRAREVTWYHGYDDKCKYNNKIHTWPSHSTHSQYSLVNFPEDVSLRTRPRIYRHYCCQVTTSNGQTIASKSSTELTLAEPPSSSLPLTVTQARYIRVDNEESVTLNCSYRGYKKSDLLKVNIYWRLGSITGPYVYHPYKEMVHAGYRGRTEITGAADLHIRGLQMSDASTYYCFVMVRLCAEHSNNEKVVWYGKGTRLILTDPNKERLVIIIPIVCAVLSLLLCLVFVVWKKKGGFCTKKYVPGETTNTTENGEHSLL